MDVAKDEGNKEDGGEADTVAPAAGSLDDAAKEELKDWLSEVLKERASR